MKAIKYQLCTEVNHGTKDKPDIQQVFSSVTLGWSECNEKIAKAEAYNGEYTIETIGYGSMTAEEARAERDKLLAETDWTQVLDAPIDAETREAYRAYRQALRDIPDQEGFPGTITWPELPTITKASPDPVDTAVDTLLGGETA